MKNQRVAWQTYCLRGNGSDHTFVYRLDKGMSVITIVGVYYSTVGNVWLPCRVKIMGPVVDLLEIQAALDKGEVAIGTTGTIENEIYGSVLELEDFDASDPFQNFMQ
jgi:hypothetical protein